MVNNPISAENFSQLYASLETLDVTQIVSTLLKIAPLREEIRRRMRQAQPRARRKRRTRAEMEALGQKAVDDLRLAQCSIPNSQPEQVRAAPRQDTSNTLKRKSRKGTPAKLNHIKSSTFHQRQTHNSGLSNGPAGVDSAGLSLGTVSPGSNQSDVVDKPLSDIEMTQAALSNSFLSTPNLRSGMNPYNMSHNSLPLPYWNAFRMTANQLLYSYTNMMMIPTLSTDLPKTTDSAAYHSDISSVTPQHSLQHLDQNTENKAQEPVESDEPHITVVDETVEESEMAEDLTLTLTTRGTVDSTDDAPTDDAPTDDAPTDDAPTDDDATTTHAKDHNASQQLTEINCPDCGVAVILSTLTSHIQNQCSKKIAIPDTTNMNMSTSSLGKMNWESCAICSESIPGKDMIKHIKLRHALGNNSFHCDTCDESFRNKSTLKRHKITHTSGGGHVCSYCAKIFAKPELLRRHEILHTEVKRILWPCSKCDKSFSNKYNLAVHDRMHTGELPFPCSHCSERFRVKCSMQNHIKSRHPEAFCRSISPSLESNSSNL